MSNFSFRAFIEDRKLTVKEVAEITGLTRRWIHVMLKNNTPTDEVLAKLAPIKPDKKKMTRGEFIKILERLSLTPDQAARILWKHHDRIKRMADPSLDLKALVPIKREDIKKLEEAAI